MRMAPGRPGFQASVRAQGHAPGPFGLNIVSLPDDAVLDGVAERALAQALLRLLASRRDRLPGVASVDWDKALGWLRGRTGSGSRS